MKGIANSLIVAILLGMLGLKLYSSMDADSRQVSELIEKSARNEDAKSLVANFLNETPAPSIGEVVHVENEIEKIYVKEATQKAISDSGLKPVVNSTKSEAYVLDTPMNRVLFGLLAVALAVAMLRTYKKLEAGD